MSAMQLPARYQNVPSLTAMQSRLQKVTGRNRELSREVKGSVGTLESVGLTQLGAALSGVGMARGWSEGTLGIAGGVIAGIGIATGQSAAVHIANGILAPITAMASAKWYANTMMGGNAPTGG